MSIMRGTKPFPNSFCKRSASACLRTEPNTRNPFEIRTFVVPQPIPVETPVTTTSLLFAIEVLLRGTVSIFIIYTVHLRYYRCQVEEEGRWKFQSPVRSGTSQPSGRIAMYRPKIGKAVLTPSGGDNAIATSE